MMYYFGNSFAPYGFFGPIMMIVYWAVIIAVIVWLVRVFSRSAGKKSDEALDTLRNRYAKGEISKEQFEEMMKTLGK